MHEFDSILKTPLKLLPLRTECVTVRNTFEFHQRRVAAWPRQLGRNWYDSGMIVTNSRHETAIVVRRDGQTVTFVRFRAGKLACERLTETMFRTQWLESSYPLGKALDHFLAHIEAHGSTQEARKGLEKLRTRDASVVASLF